MRILITGITGFVGGHLVEALPAGHTLTGVSRNADWPAGLAHLAGPSDTSTGARRTWTVACGQSPGRASCSPAGSPPATAPVTSSRWPGRGCLTGW